MINAVRNQVEELADKLRQIESAYESGQSFIRIEHPLLVVNLFAWLNAQAVPMKSYWEDREGDYKIAGLGRAWSYRFVSRSQIKTAFSLAKNKIHESGVCLSYLSFSESDSMVWPDHGYGEVFIPVVELVQTRKGCHLAVNLGRETKEVWESGISKALDLLGQLNWGLGGFDSVDYEASSPEFCPDQNRWEQLIAQALESFTKDELLKVVLSREARFKIKGTFSPWLLLQQWHQANPRSYLFGFESTSGQLFFGCSPERLFKRVDLAVYTEALAGTVQRGKNRGEDFKFELRLLNDAKNIHENNLVLDDIRTRLDKICASLEFDRSHSVVKLKTVQHLRYLIRGVLKDDIDDADLITTLHPTPAVGGSSRDKAIEFIEAFEGYPRGLYAGACGIVGHKKADFTVSIRSALSRADELLLFSGAGIVKGSEAWDEWTELNNKIKTVTNLLGVAGDDDNDYLDSNEHDQDVHGSTIAKHKITKSGILHDVSYQAS